MAALKADPGRDIWLFGGGSLFRTLLDAGLVDTVELAVVPVLLGAGVPLLPPGATTKLVLADQKTLPSGIVALSYSVPGGVSPAPRIRYIESATKSADKNSQPRTSTAAEPAGSKKKGGAPGRPRKSRRG